MGYRLRGIQLAELVCWLIRIYQLVVSPFLVPACRFYPTCSEYARQAVRQYGVWVGLRKTLVRILKCHPYHPGGYDPVEPCRE